MLKNTYFTVITIPTRNAKINGHQLLKGSASTSDLNISFMFIAGLFVVSTKSTLICLIEHG